MEDLINEKIRLRFFRKPKDKGEKLSMLTAYDYSTARAY